MSVSLPFSFTPGTKARAAEVNADFQALAAKFTEGAGGISDADISTTAGIKASKLSGVPGSRITQAQMDDDAVDLRVLKDDPTAGSPNAAVNTAIHIRDGIIPASKLVAATIAADRLKITEVTQAFSIPAGAFVGVARANIAAAPPLPAMATMLPIRCTVEGFAVVGGVAEAPIVSIFDSGGLPVYALHWYLNAVGANTTSGTIRFTYLALT